MQPSPEKILYLEKVSLTELLGQITSYYPFTQIVTIENSFVSVDIRAFESVIKNLIENASNHGKASRVIFKIERISTNAKLLYQTMALDSQEILTSLENYF